MLGDGTSLPLPEQERIAAEYLACHRGMLRQLVAFPGIKSCSVILQSTVDVHQNTVAFGLVPSRELMRLAVEIGIQPVYLVDVERSFDAQEEG